MISPLLAQCINGTGRKGYSPLGTWELGLHIDQAFALHPHRYAERERHNDTKLDGIFGEDLGRTFTSGKKSVSHIGSDGDDGLIGYNQLRRAVYTEETKEHEGRGPMENVDKQVGTELGDTLIILSLQV